MKSSEKKVLVIAILYSVFHFLIILQIIPYDIVWGGKIKSIYTIYTLEALALVVMSFLAFLIAIKNRIIEPVFTKKKIKKILFVFAVFFMLNTITNLLAETVIEKCQAIIALYLAVVLYKSSKNEHL